MKRGVDMSDCRTMTRQALMSEVQRLREAVALYQEIEEDREWEAARRRPPVVVIEQPGRVTP